MRCIRMKIPDWRSIAILRYPRRKRKLRDMFASMLCYTSWFVTDIRSASCFFRKNMWAI
jgi:hypothetical protein